jgi:hypothetical protein
LVLPHRGQGGASETAAGTSFGLRLAPAAAAAPSRGAKLTWGAAGRCSGVPRVETGGGVGVCGLSAWPSGARAVAASGEVGLAVGAPPGPRPMGGVGGATRGASR